MNQEKINCKSIFQRAYEKRYTWDQNFRGYKGKCSYHFNKNFYEGNFKLGIDFKPVINEINYEQAVNHISAQLFEVSIHRVKRNFEDIHSENNFNLLESTDKGILMKISGKNDGDKYRVKDECINMVYRKIHGTIIQIFVQEFLDTGYGFLSKKYTSQKIDPVTREVCSPKMEYEDNFLKIGTNIWILNSRSIKYSDNEKDVSHNFIFEDLSLLV